MVKSLFLQIALPNIGIMDCVPKQTVHHPQRLFQHQIIKETKIFHYIYFRIKPKKTNSYAKFSYTLSSGTMANFLVCIIICNKFINVFALFFHFYLLFFFKKNKIGPLTFIVFKFFQLIKHGSLNVCN